ncbi:MAG: hypothetical protein J6I40_04255 [Mailhella sp.]|nr:hypothetical protein [Mailhella sp.]
MPTGATENEPLLTLIDPLARDMDASLLQESLRNWLESEDLSAFYELFGIGALALKKRRQLKTAYRALCLELWRLAMARPHLSSGVMAAEAWLARQGAASREEIERNISEFRRVLPKSGEGDFSPAAKELCRLAGTEAVPSLLRAVALHIRQTYGHLVQYVG